VPIDTINVVAADITAQIIASMFIPLII